MFGLGAGEIFLILAFALIFIGPKKLPELARSLGKGVREFQNAKDELLNQVKAEAEEDPPHEDPVQQLTQGEPDPEHQPQENDQVDNAEQKDG